MNDMPVVLPPGRAKLSAMPATTGSPLNANTSGMRPAATRCTAGPTAACAMISTTPKPMSSSTAALTRSGLFATTRSSMPTALRPE